MNKQKTLTILGISLVLLIIIGVGTFNYLNKKVQVGPYYFSSEKLLELNEEDLQKQAEILTEISKGDFDNLEFIKIINPEVSKQLEK
jgi:hypothetical protein